MDDGWSLPWSWYTDPDQLGRERERIFARAWQYVGPTEEAAEPGTYFSARAGHVPVVVTRPGDGELRAFVNVCRHRGHPVVAGAGRRQTLQCPYHAWTYGLDGELVRAPRADREHAFEQEQISLRPVRAETWGPFVFVNPWLEAPPLAEALGELPQLLVSAGIDVDRLERRQRAQSEVAANWKLVCENYLECYHCPTAHPGFSALVDVSPDAYRLEAAGLVASQYGPLREGGTASYDSDGELGRGQFHFIWPNVTINVFPGHPNLSIGSVVPLEPGRTARSLDYFFAPDVEQEWVDELLAFDDQIGVEDRALVEQTQLGVASGLIERGRLLPESEQLLRHFQELTARALGG